MALRKPRTTQCVGEHSRTCPLAQSHLAKCRASRDGAVDGADANNLNVHDRRSRAQPSQQQTRSRRTRRKISSSTTVFSCALFLLCTRQISHAEQLVDISGNFTELDEWETDLKERILGFPDVGQRGAVTSSLEDLTSGELRAEPVYRGIALFLEDVLVGDKPNCYLREIDWTTRQGSWGSLRGWINPSTACASASSKRDDSKPLKNKPDEIFDLLSSRAQLMREAADGVNEKTMNYDTPFVPSSLEYRVDHRSFMQSCVAESISSVRIQTEDGGGRWFVLSTITGQDPTDDPPDWERHYVNEWVGANPEEGGKLFDPLPFEILEMLQDENGRGGIAGGERGEFATSLARWDGRPGQSSVYNMLLEDSPALQMALQESDRDIGQATDALTSSNLAILALPMVMNAVPVSLITDVSTLGLLVYTVMTDMLTTVPFIIKGFELLNMGNRHITTQETYYAGTTEDKLVLAETWTAKCQIERVDRIGAAIIGIGFAVLVVGVFLEFQAKRIRKQWKEAGKLGYGIDDDALEAALLQRGIVGKNRSKKQPQDQTFDPYDEEAAWEAQLAMQRNLGVAPPPPAVSRP